MKSIASTLLLLFPLSPALALVNQTTSPARHDRFYVGVDKNLIGSSYNWSGVGRSSSGQYATLITRDCYATCSHWNVGVGNTIRFYNGNLPTSPYEDRTVVSETLVSGDVTVGRFSSPLPAGYASYSVLNTSKPTDLMRPLNGFLFGRTDPVGLDYRLSQKLAKIQTWIWSQTKSPAPTASFSSGTLFTRFDLTVTNSDGPQSLQVGDSGGPLFTVFDGTPTLIGANFTSVSPAATCWNENLLKSKIAAVGGNIAELDIKYLPAPRSIFPGADSNDKPAVTHALANGERATLFSQADYRTPKDYSSITPTSWNSWSYKITVSDIEFRLYQPSGRSFITDYQIKRTDTNTVVTSTETYTAPYRIITCSRINGVTLNVESRINGSGLPFTFSQSLSISGGNVTAGFNDVLFTSNDRFATVTIDDLTVSEVVGGVQLHCEPGSPSVPSQNYVAPSLVHPEVWRGVVTAKSGDDITFGESMLATTVLSNDQFNGITPATRVRFQLEQLNATGSGKLFNISITNAGSGGSAGSMRVENGNEIPLGATVAVRAHFTIGDIFGPNNEAGLGSGEEASVADALLWLDSYENEAYTAFYISDEFSTGWVDPVWSDQTDSIIPFQSCVRVIRKQSPAVNWTVVGCPKRSDSYLTIYPDLNFLAVPLAVTSAYGAQSAFSLDNSNIPVDQSSTSGLWGFRGGSTYANGDHLTFELSNVPETVFYRTTVGTTGWFNSSGTARGTSLLNSGTGMLLDQSHFSSIYPFTWIVPAR